MEKFFLVKTNKFFAKQKKIPIYFIAYIDRKSPKAYHFIGTGVMLKSAMGICSICGKTLTNPNSIKLGIGPVCAKRLGIAMPKNVTHAELSQAMEEIKVDVWLPRSCAELSDVPDGVNIPNIKTSTQPNQPAQKPSKRVEIHGHFLHVFFDYCPKIVAQVRTLMGRDYAKQPRPHWVCPDNDYNRNKLAGYGFPEPA